jgi:TonB family protein
VTSKILFIIPFTLAVQCASAGGGSPVSAQAVRSSFCGRVVAVSCAGPTSAVTLQLAGPRGSSNRWVEIPPEHRSLFGPRIENRYDQQLVCVSPGAAAPARSERVLVRDPGQLVVKDTTQASMALPDDVFRTCDPDVKLPMLIRQVYANYTAEAMQAKVRGSVYLRGIVDRHGAVRDVRLVQSLEPSLDVAAREAFAQWEFRPATRAGEPVAMAVSVQMAFTMR